MKVLQNLIMKIHVEQTMTLKYIQGRTYIEHACYSNVLVIIWEFFPVLSNLMKKIKLFTIKVLQNFRIL